MKLVISKRAVLDLVSISEYGELNWGYVQSDKYIKGLNELFNLILSQPQMGKRYVSETKIFPHDYRYISYGSHSVFWTVTEAHLIIVAIIGETQLPDKYL